MPIDRIYIYKYDHDPQYLFKKHPWTLSRHVVLDMELLDPDLFNKAKGITFMDNGDMIITNEGQDHKPKLVRFIHEQ